MSTKTSSPLTLDNRVWHTDLDHPPPPPSAGAFKGRRRLGPNVRYLVLILGTLYLSLVLGCVICFNPALTVMMDIRTSPLAHSNSSAENVNYASWSLPLADRRFAFTNLQKSFLLAGTFGACLLLIGPVGLSMQLFGAWRTQLAIGFAVSMATGLIPFAASLNFYALLVIRMVLGLSITNLFPVVGAICTAWAPQAERGTFLAILSGYIQLSVIISMPLTGFLCDKFGWPSVFFVHSVLGLVLTALWAFFYRDDPAEHPWLNEEELTLIQLGKAKLAHGHSKPPYGRILSSCPIWAIFCAVLGNFLVIQFANTFLPMFLVSAMHFTNSETGILSALPLVLQFLAKWATGIVTDHLPRVPDILKVRFCNSVAFCGAAIFFLLASLFPPDSFPRWPVVLFLVLCIGILGLNSGGFTKSVVLVSAQYSSTTMVGVQTTLCATIFSASFLIPAMTSQGGQFWEYQRVFYLYAGSLFVTNLVFVLFCKANPANWTREEEEKEVDSRH